MNEKRVTGEFDKVLSGIYDNGNQLTNFEVVEQLNELHEENEQMKDIINTLFNTITELDWAKKEYCNALIRIIGEENDVDKAKQRITEFME